MSLKRWTAGLALGVTVMGTGFWLGRAAADTAEPGSPADPLVSKSYVDELALYRVVQVSPGYRAVGEGGTEIVVRSGQARAIASAQGGLLDVTSGVDLQQDAAIANHHMLIVPRTDGRGVLAVTELFLMVKGPITLVSPQK